MRESALIVSKTLGMIALKLRRSNTLHLDKLAEEFIRDQCRFLGLYGFQTHYV
jgi:hypothetical protein